MTEQQFNDHCTDLSDLATRVVKRYLNRNRQYNYLADDLQATANLSVVTTLRSLQQRNHTPPNLLSYVATAISRAIVDTIESEQPIKHPFSDQQYARLSRVPLVFDGVEDALPNEPSTEDTANEELECLEAILLQCVDNTDRLIVELSLQGLSAARIAKQLSMSVDSVRRRKRKLLARYSGVQS